MTTPHPGLARWHHAMQSHDPALIPALLAEDAVFHSPIVHTPQRGRDIVTAYLTAATHVLNTPDFHYVGEWLSPDGAVLEFNTKLDGLTIDGIDMIRWNDAGEIVEFKVMVRPLKAINLVHQKMGEMLMKLAG